MTYETEHYGNKIEQNFAALHHQISQLWKHELQR